MYQKFRVAVQINDDLCTGLEFLQDAGPIADRIKQVHAERCILNLYKIGGAATMAKKKACIATLKGLEGEGKAQIHPSILKWANEYVL